MILAAGVLGVSALLAGQAATAPQASPNAPSVFGSADEERRSLALVIDSAIKVCSEESARASTRRTEIGKVEKRATDAGVLTWVTDPSPALIAQAQGRKARFGRWADPHATIWMIAYDEVATCRILVGGTPWAADVRPALYAKIQDDHYWIADGAEQPIEGGLVRAVFHPETPPAVTVRPMITVVAPVKESEGATQLSIGVHLVSKEDK